MSTNQTINLQFVLQHGGKVVAGMKAIGNESVNNAKKITQAQLLANTQTARSYERLQSEIIAGTRRASQAREVLGIRSEHAIQREIQRTEAAYNRLARSGTLSNRELARAQDATLRKVRELNTEMRTASTLQSKLQTMLSAGAALTAGGYVVKREADKAMSFDKRLALMSNTAFAERDVTGRRAGMRELEAVINRSVRSGIGGGTREDAAEALDAMIARNTLGIDRSKAFLPTVMRTATGAGASPLEIANLSSVLVGQNIVGNEDQLKTALNMITAAGQAGGFEIKDMAKWLSQQLPLAQKSGLVGLDGLQKVLTMNQAAVLTAGSADSAGNNVRNLLGKLNSSDTAKDFDKQHGGNLSEFLMKQRVQGVDAVDAWMKVLDKESANNPELKNILAKLKTTNNPADQKALLSSLSAISEGTVIGRYFQDIEATGALLGMRNKTVVDKVNTEIGQNRTVTGVNDVNYALMQTTESAKLEAAAQAKDAASKAAMDGLTPVIGKVATQFEILADKNPLLTGATVVATTAISAMGVAAGLASVALGKTGGGLPAGVAGGVVGAGGRSFLAGAAGAVAGAISSLPGMGVGSLMHGLPVIGAMPGMNETLFNGPSGGWGNVMSQYFSQPSQATEPAQVETTVRVELADGLKAVHQTSTKKGAVSLWAETGSVWGQP